MVRRTELSMIMEAKKRMKKYLERKSDRDKKNESYGNVIGTEREIIQEA